MPEARFPVEMVNGVPVVAAPEEIDITNAGELRTALLESAARRPGSFVVDLTRTQFCDTSGHPPPPAPSKPILVASHDQWRRFEEALTYPAKLYARLNVTAWARCCEMIGFRPCDFDFGQQMLNITRSTV